MMHVVRIPGPLRSYTQGAAQVEASGDTLVQLLAALDRDHPGMRFRIIDEQDRIRPHIRIFVNRHETPTLAATLAAGDAVHLICALSGG
jgi:molybdopterin converting factor small subunit